MRGCVAESLRDLADTVKKLKHGGIKDRLGSKDQPRSSRSNRTQLALEGPRDGPRDTRAVTDLKRARSPRDKDKYITVKGKQYKKGLLVKILVKSFGYEWTEAWRMCFSFILSAHTDPVKRLAGCSQQGEPGHKTATDTLHAFTKVSELLKLHDEQYQKDYVFKQDFR